MRRGDVGAQRIDVEVAARVAHHGVDVVGAVLPAVVLDEEALAEETVVVRGAGLGAARPGEAQRGIVLDAGEECDLGRGMNLGGYGGCTYDCRLGANIVCALPQTEPLVHQLSESRALAGQNLPEAASATSGEPASPWPRWRC